MVLCLLVFAILSSIDSIQVTTFINSVTLVFMVSIMSHFIIPMFRISLLKDRLPVIFYLRKSSQFYAVILLMTEFSFILCQRVRTQVFDLSISCALIFVESGLIATSDMICSIRHRALLFFYTGLYFTFTQGSTLIFNWVISFPGISATSSGICYECLCSKL